MNTKNNTGDAGDSPVISCTSCKACCCRLEVMLMGDDDIPLELTEQDRWGGWVMARLDDGWCSALDRNTMLCTIYERRPMICRDYQVGDFDCIQERLLHTPARIESHGAFRMATSDPAFMFEPGSGRITARLDQDNVKIT